MEDSIQKIMFMVLIMFFALGFYMELRLLRYLKHKHVSVWKQLGEPSMFFNNSMKTGMAMRTFEEKQEYLLLNDTYLNGLIKVRKRLTYCYFGLLICTVLLFLISGMVRPR